jgi:hypothetical protein
MMRWIEDSPAIRTMRDIENSPAARLMRDMESPPVMRMMRDLERSPAFEISRSIAESLKSLDALARPTIVTAIAVRRPTLKSLLTSPGSPDCRIEARDCVCAI